MKPLAVDLCCGLGGWSDGLLAEGWDVVGFDIEEHRYGDMAYPAQLVLQDITTLDGRQFRGKVSLIVASPPCQKYSYMAMPWTRAKRLIEWYRDAEHPERLEELNRLFDACLRIGREAECPVVIENVVGAQRWVGRAKWRYGSFYLWGDVPALMPIVTRVPAKRAMDDLKYGHRKLLHAHLPVGDGPLGRKFNPDRKATKNTGGSWFNVAHNTTSGKGQNPDGRKTHGHPHTKHLTNPGEHGVKLKDQDGYERSHPNAFGWKSPRTSSGAVNARKAASAMIAKIPPELARWIARAWKPAEVES